MNHKSTYQNLDVLKKAITEENEYLGCTSTTFRPASDNVNLICEVLSTDILGVPIVDGHIYKSFDKKLKPCFIVRLYDDL
jgi:hypothetical protein